MHSFIELVNKKLMLMQNLIDSVLYLLDLHCVKNLKEIQGFHLWFNSI